MCFDYRCFSAQIYCSDLLRTEINNHAVVIFLFTEYQKVNIKYGVGASLFCYIYMQR